MFYISNLQKGGAERVVSVLANKMSETNEVFIVNSYKNKSQYILNKKIKQIFLLDDDKTNKLLKNFLMIRNLKNVEKKYKPDVVVSFLPEPCYRACLVKLITRIPLILSVRNDPRVEYNGFFKRVFTRIIYSLSDGIVFQTDEAMNFFQDSIKRKSIIIPNPINDNFLNFKNFPEKQNIIVAAGRLEPQKNHLLLIDAFRDILATHNDYVLKIYGKGELENFLNDKIVEYGLEDNVFLMGHSDELYSDIANAKVYVLSSDYEGMPNSLMEAMALGIPCVSTDCPCGGPRFLISNMKDGILIPMNDKKKLVDSIDLLICNEKLSNDISINSRKKMKQFSSDIISKNWVNYFTKIQNR